MHAERVLLVLHAQAESDLATEFRVHFDPAVREGRIRITGWPDAGTDLRPEYKLLAAKAHYGVVFNSASFQSDIGLEEAASLLVRRYVAQEAGCLIARAGVCQETPDKRKPEWFPEQGSLRENRVALGQLAQKIHREIVEPIPSLIRFESKESEAEAARRAREGHSHLVADQPSHLFLNGHCPSGGDVVGGQFKLLWTVWDGGKNKMFAAADLNSERHGGSGGDWYLRLVHCSSNASGAGEPVEDLTAKLEKLSHPEIVGPTRSLWRERGFSFFASGYYRHQGSWQGGVMSPAERLLPTVAEQLFSSRIPQQRNVAPFCNLLEAVAAAHRLGISHGAIDGHHLLVARSESGDDIQLRLVWPAFMGSWEAPTTDTFAADIRSWATMLLTWSLGTAVPPLQERGRLLAILKSRPWTKEFREFVEECLFLRRAKQGTAYQRSQKFPREQLRAESSPNRTTAWIL